MELSLRYTPQAARRLLFGLLIIEMLFVVAYIITHMTESIFTYRPLQRLFDLDGDLSIPAWFSSVQLLTVSVLLFLLSRQDLDKHPLPNSLFTIGGFIFFFLALDEGVAIHEQFTGLAIRLSFDWMLFKGNHGAWITGYMMVAIPAVWVARPYIRKAWKYFRYEAQLALSGVVVFVTGAVGFEIISYLFLRSAQSSALYKTEVIFEEFFEMSGVSIILYAVVQLAYTISHEQHLSSFKQARADS
jgi:hypothetical protein